MADDLSLLLKIKGDSASGKAAISETRAAIAQLRSTFGTEFGAMQNVATNALGKVTQSLTGFAGQVPIVGGAVSNLSSGLASMSVESEATGASILALAEPIGLAVVAVAALAGGVAIVTKELFSLAEAAADFRGKMFDLSQQTGVAVETLSTLEIVAKTTGGNIEGIAQSLVIFQGHLDEAQDSASKMGIKFKELGISINDTETAFRDALKQISKMPEGFDQTNTAAELFGRRGGKQVLAILKELGGDLDGATKRFREMGLVISTEDAKAADEFNDQLAILNFQFRAALGKDIIPAALVALKALSSLFTENREAIKGFGQALGLVSQGLLAAFLQKLQEVQIAMAAIIIAAHALDRIRGIILPGVTAGVGADNRLGGLTSGVGAVEPAKKATGPDPAVAAARLAALRLQATLEGLTEEDRITKQSLDRRKIDFELYAIETKHIEDRRHEQTMIGLERELRAAENLRNAHQREIALLEIDNKKTEENNRHKAAADELDDKRAKIQQEIKDTIEKLNASTKEYVTHVDQYQQAVDALVESLKKQGTTLNPLIEKQLRFDAAVAGARDRAIEALKALEDLSNAPPPPGSAKLGDKDTIGQAVGAIVNAQLGPPPEVIDKWKELKSTAMDALQNMAQGVGGLIQQWVIYGNVGPNAVRKMIAAILATAAAQAAVEAIMQLAFAWKEAALASASLAVFDVRGAALHSAASAAHLTSAAVFGTVAGIAAVAGRVVAGNSFNQNQGGGSGSGSSSSSGRGTSTTPATKEVDRRGFNAPQGGMTLTLRVPHGWLGDELRKDFDLNGYSRLLITSER